jgi:hypothetical protein
MVGEFGGQHALGQLLLQQPGQPRFAQNRFRILVLDLRQQLVNQFVWKQLWCVKFRLRRLAHCVGHDVSLSLLFHDLSTQKLTGSRLLPRNGSLSNLDSLLK